MFAGLEICVCVPLGSQLGVYLDRLVLIYSLAQTPCHFYISTRVHSILQVLLFAGLNELVVVSNVFMDVAVQCGWIYILVWRCFPEHQSYVYLNE